MLAAISVVKIPLWTSVVYGGRTPSISWITKKVVMGIGDTVDLECSVQYAGDYPVLWVKKGTDGTQDFPISSNAVLIVRNPRYALRHYRGSSMYILQIRDLQENDGGEYMCLVLIDIENKISASVPLLIRRPPAILDNSTRSVVVSEGTPVKLECYATGLPIPKVLWRRENDALLPTGGSVYSGNELLISGIRREDSGTYSCIAENGVGRGARRNIRVQVQFPPVVNIQKPLVYQALLSDAILECRVEAYPPAATSWIFDSEMLVNNEHYEISQFSTSDKFTVTTLRIQNIEKMHYGNYTCQAINMLGVSEGTIVLSGQTQFSSSGVGSRTPNISRITKEIVMDIGGSVDLECSVQYAGDYPVLWVKKGTDGTQDFPISSNTALLVRDPRYDLRHDKASSTYILHIRDLQENDGGEYTCQVLIDMKNSISASVPLLIRRPSVEVEFSPVVNIQKPIVYQALSSDAILECRVEAYPLATTSWIFDSEMLVNNEHYETSQFSTSDKFTVTTLRIQNIEKMHYGNYTCQAVNVLGVSEGTIVLSGQTQFSLLGVGSPTPNISRITKEIVMDIGGTVDLECSVQYAKDYPVLWVKKGTDGTHDLPISSNTALLVRDPRYDLRHDKASSTYILHIRDLQENDGGKYMCQVLIDMKNTISASVPLLIRRPPVILGNSTRSVVVSEGTPVKLECYASGLPIPQVSWRRENAILLPTGGLVFSGNELLIPRIRREDSGTYSCIAENGVGRGARRNINVEVQFSPVINIQKPIVYQALLSNAILECRVEAYPPAATSWIFDSEMLVNNEHYEISQFSTSDKFTVTTLRIQNIEKMHYGNYTCQAINMFGVSEGTIVLSEFTVPNLNYPGILQFFTYFCRSWK